jgi:hypothetical protein
MRATSLLLLLCACLAAIRGDGGGGGGGGGRCQGGCRGNVGVGRESTAGWRRRRVIVNPYRLRGGGIDFGDEDGDKMWRMETRARVGNMKIDGLKASLKEKGLPVSGSKSDLIRRYKPMAPP